MSSSFGNAILSRYPFISFKRHQLNTSTHNETRAMICVEVDVGIAKGASHNQDESKNTMETEAGDQWKPWSSPSIIQVVMTHLEQRLEGARIEQMGQVLSYVDRQKPHIIMGDFNSLSRSDYDEETWTALVDLRRKNYWDPPLSELTDALSRDHHYKDTWAQFHPDKFDYLYNDNKLNKTTEQENEKYTIGWGTPTRNNHWTERVHKNATWYSFPPPPK